MQTRLVGIDCATQDTKIGVAYGDFSDGQLAVLEAFACTKEKTAAEAISNWLQERREPVLLAIDAPLGWPQSLSRVLTNHRAGEELKAEANDMFRRATDHFVKQKTRKAPLEVGADRIARTAHAALCLLRDLRHELKAEIPLAWEWPLVSKVSAIEVYPAATLVAHSLRSTGYKKPLHEVKRNEIIRKLSDIAYIPFDISRKLLASGDALDAAICLLAAKDFLSGEAMRPTDQARAEAEGWIWVREIRRDSHKGKKAQAKPRKRSRMAETRAE
jgi:RNase H-fold protein (predicted Holliday junction resolvase)